MARDRVVRRALAGVLVASGLTAVPTVVPAGATTPGVFVVPDRTASDPSSYVTVIGDSDDPLTDGAQVLYRTDDEIWFGGRTDDTVVVRVGDPDPRNDQFELAFGPPPGETLREGEYVDPSGEPGLPGRAYLEAVVDSGSCGAGPDSRLTVHDVAPDLTHFWVGYRMRCGDGEVRGEVRVDLPAASTGPLVTAQEVSWGRSHPGRAHTPQRVFLLNPGLGPVSIGAARVEGPFSLDATSCGVLLAGADCEVDLSYRPTTRDLEVGRLVVPTSAGPPLQVTLSGVGTVGQHQLAARQVTSHGGTRDHYVVGGGDVAAVATGDRSWIYVGFETPYADDHTPISWVQVTAPPGQRLVEGRVYTARGGGSNRPVAFNVGCVGDTEAPSYGRFAFRELAFRADGTVAGLQLSAQERCDSGDTTTALVSWQATSPTPPFPPSIEVTTEQRRREGRDHTLEVTARATLGHGIDHLDVHAITRDGRRLLVGSGVPDRAGRVIVSARISGPTTFVASGVDDTGTLVSGVTSVNVLKGVDVLLQGVTPLRPPVLPASTRRVRVGVRAYPAVAGSCIGLQVQRLERSGWRSHRRVGCVRTDGRGRGAVRLRVVPGQVLRLRAVWVADRYSDTFVGPWKRFRVKRR